MVSMAALIAALEERKRLYIACRETQAGLELHNHQVSTRNIQGMARSLNGVEGALRAGRRAAEDDDRRRLARAIRRIDWHMGRFARHERRALFEWKAATDYDDWLAGG